MLKNRFYCFTQKAKCGECKAKTDNPMPDSILIVDDEKHTRDGLKAALSIDYDVAGAANVEEAKRLLQAEKFDLVLTDLRMGTQSGMNLLEYVKNSHPKCLCIMMTAYGTIASAVEAMRKGACDFITKPIDLDTLDAIIKKALSQRKKEEMTLPQQTAQNTAQQKKQPQPQTPDEKFKIISQSPVFEKVLQEAKKAAASKATILLTGETGTGKELVAHYIHKNSPRSQNPFVVVHCSAIPSTLLESELFGYEKGAFTGAVARKIGKFEAANNGTVFLDEIGEIDATTQVKLLRFLESKSFERIGNTESITVDARLVCATNKNLAEMVENGEFRQDLFYRLNVVQICLPPLRERPEDIEPMLKYYISYFAKENGLPELEISKGALDILKAYAWPGNIRELRNFCENKVVMQSSNTITESDLDGRFSLSAGDFALHTNVSESANSLSKRDNELALIKKALKETGNNKTKAAELMGISRRTLHRKLNEFGLEQ